MFDMLAANPVVAAVGLALVHFVWQGAAIAAATAWLLYRLRDGAATSRYAVGCLALLLMTIAPIATTFGALSEPAAIPAAAPMVPRTVTDDGQSAPLTTTSAGAAVMSDAAAHETGHALAFSSLASTLPLIVLAWIAGVSLLTLNLMTSWMRARTMRRMASPIGAPWQDQMLEIASRLGLRHVVTLSMSARIDVPTLVGWMRPVILMPASVLSGLTPSQLEAILTHELAHIRRHDYLVNLLQSAVETLLFYHPAVWWVSGRVRVERELCCDELVIAVCGDRVTYARALASLETLRGQPAILGVAATGGALLDRVRRILTPEPADASRSSAWSVLTAAVCIVPVVLAGGVAERATSADQNQPAPVAAVSPIEAPVPAARPARPMPAVRAVSPTPARTAASAVAPVQVQPPPGATSDQAAVLALEEAFRLAKVQNDTSALDRLLDAAYNGTNQNGNTRDKTETIDLWRTFRVSLLTLDAADVRVTGDLATVTGRQTEINATGTDTMLFTRVWRRADSTWRLFSMTQFRDPNPQTAAAARPGPMLFQMEYELFRNDALLGRPTVTVVAGQPWSFQVPGEAPVRLMALPGNPANDGEVLVNLLPGSASAPVPTLVLRGSEPAEGSWSSGTTAYRMRIRNVTAVPGSRPAVRVGGDIRRPTLVRGVDPVYPPEAKAAGVGGMVILELVIDEAGNVADATVIRSVPMLDAAAVEAVRQWQYTPTLLNGKPVRVMTSVNVTFAVR